MITQRGERGAPGRGAGGALPRQPRRPRGLRPADGPGRRARRRPCRRTRPSMRLAGAADRRTQRRKVRPPRSSSSTARGAGTPRNGVWMGYERKRGKLADLNALLARPRRRPVLAGRRRHQHPAAGEVRHHPRYRHAAAARRRPAPGRRDGAPAQPRAVRRERRQRVTEGYGILQPRVAVSLPGANRSRYARLWASEPGIDPYTRVVSDVYQDLFGEGSFIGKGIYDVDAFDTGGGRPLPGEPDPQPRPARRLLRARRPPDRCAGVRGLPVTLRRGRAAALPLDSRRLAVVALAAAGRAGRATAGAAGTRFPRLCRWKLVRQPAPQPRARGADRHAARRVGAARRPRGPGRSSAWAACCCPP